MTVIANFQDTINQGGPMVPVGEVCWEDLGFTAMLMTRGILQVNFDAPFMIMYDLFLSFLPFIFTKYHIFYYT